MLSSALLLMNLQAGCLAGNPPADCPRVDCAKNDQRERCQLDGAVRRQIKEAWQVSDGLNKHGAMVKSQPKRPMVKPKKKTWYDGRVLRCGAGVAMVSGGIVLALDKNWMNRSLGVIATGAGLWFCAMAR